MQSFFIGVDGGGSKCSVRVEDQDGRLLGTALGGPANIRLSVSQAWESINAALISLLSSRGLSLGDKKYRWHAAMGLAGCEVPSAYHGFLNTPHPFDTLLLTSDAHTACLGAHAGHDGAILIIGTGMVGLKVYQGETAKVSGWGFPHDDEGGGAWLGLKAVSHTLQWLDGRMPASGLAKMIYARFNHDIDGLVSWANAANSTAFAGLAPLIIEQASVDDRLATDLLKQAGFAIDKVAEALVAANPQAGAWLPFCIVGGLAPFIENYLGNKLRANLVSCQNTPDKGAIGWLHDQIG